MGMSENRELILKSALRLFAERGYDAVGVQEIAEAAGVQKPTLYHYFGSKTGLLHTLLEENFAPLFAELEKSAIYHHDVKNALEAVAATYFRFARQQPRFYRLQLSLWFAAPDSEPFQAVAPFNQRQQALLETLFTAAALDHGNMQDRQRAYAATFLGMINTYAAIGLNHQVELDQTLVMKSVHQFMHGIFS
jgi:TetR/AcrR family transcriptional regulator